MFRRTDRNAVNTRFMGLYRYVLLFKLVKYSMERRNLQHDFPMANIVFALFVETRSEFGIFFIKSLFFLSNGYSY